MGGGRRRPYHLSYHLSTQATEHNICCILHTLGIAILLLTFTSSSTCSVRSVRSEIDLKVMPGDRWALVGPNGAGKSTLLKALLGDEMVRVSNGKVTVKRGCRVGYLEQTAVSGSTRTVKEEVTSRMARLVAAKDSLAQAEKAVENGDYSEEALQCLADASEEFEAAGGFTVDERVSRVLGGLGFTESDQSRPVSGFSGGWQMRIALARLLLSEPELLMLDEPTNHLDAAARAWLARYLSTYPGTLLVVSHDAELLEQAVTSVAEVRFGRVEAYRSRTHAQWLVEREERQARLEAEYEAQQREMDRLQGFVDRFGAKASKASQAQSRVKALERMQKDAIAAPTKALNSRSAKFTLPKPPPCHTDMLKLQGAAFGWDQNKPPLVSGVNLQLSKGNTLVVRGPNGAGKSTLMAALRGKLPLLAGERVEGQGLDIGVFTQDLAQDLDQKAVAVDYVLSIARQYNPNLKELEARTIMGSLGLTGDKATRTIGLLSGGEKARVALAAFSLVPHTLLLLDEPTNHLDVGTIGALIEALGDYTGRGKGAGAIVVVSHDRHFCESLPVTHVATVRDGVCVFEQRGLMPADWAYGEEDMAGDTKYAAEEEDDPTLVCDATGACASVQDSTLGDQDRVAVANATMDSTDEELVSFGAGASTSTVKPLSAYEVKEMQRLEVDTERLADEVEAAVLAVQETAAAGDADVSAEAVRALAELERKLAEKEDKWAALAERAEATGVPVVGLEEGDIYLQ